MDALQPHRGPIRSAVYLPADPDRVFWGELPCGADEPALTIDPGTEVTIDTISHEGILEDQGRDPAAYFGAHGASEVLEDAVALAATSRDRGEGGPHVVTGAIAVRGAMPGDVLTMTLVEALPRVPYGVISNRHSRGALPAEYPVGGQTVSVFASAEDGVGRIARVAGGLRDVRFALAPFLGIMGVAVAGAERPHSVPPGMHGGNLDLNLLTLGSSLHLPVQVPGALAYVGDPHFAQGDGEVALTAMEASLRVTVRFDLSPGPLPVAGPLAETDEYLVPTGLDVDLNVAVEHCVRNAIALLRARYGMDAEHAYAYLSAATDFDITQVVDRVKGVHARIRKADFDTPRPSARPLVEAARAVAGAPTTNPGADGLLDAFWAYERALMANDLAALDELFAPGTETLRGDGGGILVGHDAISAFRRGRGGAPARSILHVTTRELTDASALVIAVTAPATGGRGQQTQLWRRVAGRWQVVAAHVSAPTNAIDSSVWRLVGAPLVAGAPDGALRGHTVAVKDLYAVRGYPVGAGVPAWLAAATPPGETAPAVAALLDAGADVTGIAQTDEFAYSIAGRNPHYGTPLNPAVLGGVPGGSSNGPASAVALGQASIGLGTDTAGSVRVPASYQGLWGLRSTHGAVSLRGVLPLAPSFDTVGWLTRDAATLRAAASVSIRPGVRPAEFVSAPALLAFVEPDVRAAFEAIDRFEHVDLGDVDGLFSTFRTVQQAEAWRAHGPWIQAHPGALGEDVAARFELASRVTSAQEESARAAMATARERLDAVLGDRVLVLPTASSVAPSVFADPELTERTRQGTLRLTCIAGLTGRPGLSAPLLHVPQPGALTPAPVGVSLVGPRGSDLALIDLAPFIIQEFV